MRNEINRSHNLNAFDRFIPGFDRRDCAVALRSCHGELDAAALWLTENARPASFVQQPSFSGQSDASSLRSASPAPSSTATRQSSITVDATAGETAEVKETTYLQGSPISFSNIEIKTR